MKWGRATLLIGTSLYRVVASQYQVVTLAEYVVGSRRHVVFFQLRHEAEVLSQRRSFFVKL